MERWEIHHRSAILELYLASKSVTQAQRDFHRKFHLMYAPSRKSILRYAEAFREHGTVVDRPKTGVGRTA